MPVNAQEKVQVGHYYLLKRDYAQAERWYREAERELPLPAPVEVRTFMDYLAALQGPRDFSFFHYYCLTKLGRPAEARAKLDQFHRLFLPRIAEAAAGQAPAGTVIVEDKTLERHLQDLLDPSKLVGRLLQDLYVAEVFLSLDAAEDAEAFFRTAPDQGDSSAARLSRSMALGQILLLEKKHREYADLATDITGPLLIKMLKPASPAVQRDFLDPAALAEFLGGFALLPLGASEFLSLLPEKQLQSMRSRWEKLQAKATGNSRLVADFVLSGLYHSLGQKKEWQEAVARLKSGPAGNGVLPREGEVGKAIVTLRRQIQELMQRR